MSMDWRVTWAVHTLIYPAAYHQIDERFFLAWISNILVWDAEICESIRWIDCVTLCLRI